MQKIYAKYKCINSLNNRKHYLKGFNMGDNLNLNDELFDVIKKSY